MLLRIDGFSLDLRGSDGRVLPVLEDIRLDVDRGECLGIAGESGSGKTVLALALMGLIPSESIAGRRGNIQFAQTELLSLSEEQFRPLRGAKIAMVFQEPMTAMNPLLTIEEQIGEAVSAHHPGFTGRERLEFVDRALRRAGFPQPELHRDSFPHQLSGGMRQRAMLAMALVLDPELILADEPTTALDAGLQVQLLRELRGTVKEGGHALMFISHDLGAIRAVADRLAVLYAGRLMEVGPAAEVLSDPAHPYTSTLVGALPRLTVERKLPQAIPGHLPAPDRKPRGCVFSDRCPGVQPRCTQEIPVLVDVRERRQAACFFPKTAHEACAIGAPGPTSRIPGVGN